LNFYKTVETEKNAKLAKMVELRYRQISSGLIRNNLALM